MNRSKRVTIVQYIRRIRYIDIGAIFMAILCVYQTLLSCGFDLFCFSTTQKMIIVVDTLATAYLGAYIFYLYTTFSKEYAKNKNIGYYINSEFHKLTQIYVDIICTHLFQNCENKEITELNEFYKSIQDTDWEKPLNMIKKYHLDVYSFIKTYNLYVTKLSGTLKKIVYEYGDVLIPKRREIIQSNYDKINLCYLSCSNDKESFIESFMNISNILLSVCSEYPVKNASEHIFSIIEREYKKMNLRKTGEQSLNIIPNQESLHTISL